MTAPLYGFGATLSTGDRPGVVVGVFLDGLRAANHFRCYRCDYAGVDVVGMTDLLPIETGYVYLLADADGEFLAREADVRRATLNGARVRAPEVAAAIEAGEPTPQQARYLRALARLDLGTGVPLTELHEAIGVRSLYAVIDQVRRLAEKGLCVRSAVGDPQRRREMIGLTEAARAWLIRETK